MKKKTVLRREILLTPGAGVLLDTAVREAVATSRRLQRGVWFSFNDTLIQVSPVESVEEVFTKYDATRAEQQAASAALRRERGR